MQANDTTRLEERILVLARDESDAQAISTAAAEGGYIAAIAPETAQLCAAIREGAGAVVLVDAGLSPPDVRELREVLLAQEPWSDLPILIIPADVEQEEARQRMLHLADLLGPLSCMWLLERPLQSPMIRTRFAAALRTRRHQYVGRALREQLAREREQLDLERRRHVAVLSALPVGLVILDAGGRAVESNEAFRRICGLTPGQSVEDARALKAWTTGPSHEATPFVWRDSRVLATGHAVQEEEVDIEAFDGVHRTILCSALPVRDARDETSGAVGVFVDITERARWQRARQILSQATAVLIESLDPSVTLHSLSRIVVTTMADCCAIDELDDRGQLHRLVAETRGTREADAAARLLAFVPAASGNSLAMRVLKSQRPLLVSDVSADWLATGLEADEHRAAFAKIGASSLMALPLIARGRPLGVIGIVSTTPDRRYDASDLALAEEISRRAAIALDNARLHRRAESALRARDDSLAEFDAFLNASPVGFAVLDRTLHFQRVNDVLAKWHGRGADEVLGQALEDVVPPAFEAQLAPLFERVLATGASMVDQPISGELPPSSGKTKHFLSSFFPLLDVVGMPRAAGAVVTDVTGMKDAEEALREEATFRERFIGVLAHDLRSPLAAVALSAQTLLRKGDAPEPWVRNVDRIAHAAARMGRMVGNLLDLVRSRQGGGIPITRAPTDLGEITRRVVAELEAAHPGHEVAVTVEGDTRAPLDADRMAEVVSNLAGNALAYSPADAVVHVDVAGRDGELTLAVHNRGAPMSPEKVKTLFAPFKRGVHAGVGPPSMRGLGLGLYIVGEITRAHGGSVDVKSTVEEGTTFTVRIPRGARGEPVADDARV